jgi:5'-nucleotidase
MKLHTVFIDMDEVIADLLSEWCDRLNLSHGTDVHPDEILDWDMMAAFPTVNRYDLYGVLHDGDLYDDVREIDGAWQAVQRIREAGLNVGVATSCVSGSMVDQKNDWLIERDFIKPHPYGGLSKELFPLRDKSTLRGDGCALIDDYFVNLENYTGRKIIFSRPHNQSVLGDFERADDWSDALKLLGVK